MASKINKRTTGLYEKFHVFRTDGRDAPDKKHDGCEYFVLDLTHDRFAPDAILAYANACRKAAPVLARDLEAKANNISRLDRPIRLGHGSKKRNRS